MIKYYPEQHKYVNENGESLISVTSLIDNFKQRFNPKDMALKVSQQKGNKFYNHSVDEIEKIWANEFNRSVTLGNWYHKQREDDMAQFKNITIDGVNLPIIMPQRNGEIKEAPCQVLTNGIYVEHLVYLESTGVAGQIDRVDIINKDVYLKDHKTNKEIAMESRKSWNGVSKKMMHPLSHLDDCKFNHIQLQLSMYMYMILKHNPQFNPKEIKIHHAIFEEESKRDKYGYPLIKYDANGEPILKNIVQIDCRYLKKEVVLMLEYYNKNKKLFNND